MALQFIGAGSASATTVTIPAGHHIGDIIIISAFRSSSTTIPTLPAGWTSLGTNGANVCGSRLGWKRAVSTSDTSGTWTSATQLAVAVYRGCHQTTPFGTASNTNGTGSTLTFASITPKSAKSWVIGTAGHVSATNANVAPTGMTIRASTITNVGLSDTNAITDSFPSTTLGVNASAGWETYTVELFQATTVFNNFQFANGSSNNAGVISMTEKIR